MIYYIEKHIPSLLKDIHVYDSDGASVYSVESKLFLGTRHMVLYDDDERPQASIVQQLPSIEPRFAVSVDHMTALTVTKRFAFFEPSIAIEASDQALRIEGDLINLDFSVVSSDGRTLAAVSDVAKDEPLYSVDIASSTDERLMLSLLVVLDHMLND